ncbi:MAG: 2-oxo acid dehydrogenase subunit E2 [Dehalococcoidia bacterium]|nr:2-oxo acid dehydrogenase subunit E2 [Dehalococcoidia bacterium]
MATVTMPQLGESVTEGTILSWLKQPGDPVHLDDPLCEIETEKVTAELPSPLEGTMGEILVSEGETVLVGAPLCEIAEGTAAGGPAPARAGGGWSGGPMAIPPEESGTSSDEVAGAVAAHGGAPGPAAVQPVAVAERILRSPDDRSRFYSPAVLRLASERGVDLAGVEGTGVAGRVTRKDVERFLATGPAVSAAPAAASERVTTPAVAAARGEPATGFETVQLTATRRTIAENMARSNREAPQAWTMVEADVTGLVRRRERERERFESEEGESLTLLPYFTTAVCETLREFPMLNARWEGEELRRYHAFHLGIAVATETGLVVPVVHDAGDLSVTGLARRIADLARRAHSRKLRVEDVEGGTFTVNNTGSFGSIASKPIVNYPQVAIVSMERAVRRPIVVADDAIAVRWMMNVCLSFDHRALDGQEAGGFLAALKGRLEAIG